MLGPKAKKEIFGHHRMWKEVPNKLGATMPPGLQSVCTPRPPPQHTYIPPITKVRGKPAATLSPPQPLFPSCILK